MLAPKVTMFAIVSVIRLEAVALATRVSGSIPVGVQVAAVVTLARAQFAEASTPRGIAVAPAISALLDDCAVVLTGHGALFARGACPTRRALAIALIRHWINQDAAIEALNLAS